MMRCPALLFLSTLVASPIAIAQAAPPGPAPELKQLEPLVGNWRGKGKLTEPDGKATNWEARGTYRWALDGHFLQEDFAIAFTDKGSQLVFRSYLGWDRENKRYVTAMIDNSGKVALHELTLLPDGTLLQMMLQYQQGQPYVERSLLKVEGDKLLHSLDLLLGKGPSTTMIDCAFERGGERFDGQLDAPPFMGAEPAAAIARLGRSAGAYAVAGEMLMAHGQPPMRITGVDTFTPAFRGLVLHGHAEGSAEGVPGKYVGEVFWGHDAAKDCLRAVYLSNLGEVMLMDGRWSGDGKLVSTSTGLWMGQPSVQRMVMEFDAAGSATRARSDTILGTAPPYESFHGTYTKK